jgi:nucleotide-binding universal stress UspA family protein
MKVVVGVDGSEHSQRAVEWCAGYASAVGADVVAVHAIEIPMLAAPGIGYVPTPTLSDDECARLEQIIDTEWCKPLHEAGVAVRVVVAHGNAANVVIDSARKEDADLVVTGRRGRGGFAELLLGSTSHQLSHHLDRPLVIVP